MKKICSNCNIEKDLSEYYADKRASGGKRAECKKCFNARTQRYKHTPYAKQRRKEINNTPQFKQKLKEYNSLPKSKERVKKYQATDKAKRRKKEINNTPISKQKRREYEQKRRESGYYEQPHIKKSRDAYFKKIEIVNIRNKKRRDRRKIDPKFKLKCNVSSSICQSLKRNKSSKSNCTWEKLVGYTLNQLKKHLEKLFQPGMTWENYGSWHIDHKLPVVVFNFSSPSHKDFKRCWDLSNLQPMWALENKKKNAKILKEYINE